MECFVDPKGKGGEESTPVDPKGICSPSSCCAKPVKIWKGHKWLDTPFRFLFPWQQHFPNIKVGDVATKVEGVR